MQRTSVLVALLLLSLLSIGCEKAQPQVVLAPLGSGDDNVPRAIEQMSPRELAMYQEAALGEVLGDPARANAPRLAITAIPASRKGRTTGELNCRNGIGTGAKCFATLPAGVEVDIKDGGWPRDGYLWFRIGCPAARIFDGYVSGHRIDAIGGSIPVTTFPPPVTTYPFKDGDWVVVTGTQGVNLNVRSDAVIDDRNIRAKLPEGTFCKVAGTAPLYKTGNGLLWVQVGVDTPQICTWGWCAVMYLSKKDPGNVQQPNIPKFATGDWVKVVGTGTDQLKFRGSAGYGGALLRFWPDGTVGKVLNGTGIIADGWRWVQWNVGGAIGWSADAFLAKTADPTPPEVLSAAITNPNSAVCLLFNDSSLMQGTANVGSTVKLYRLNARDYGPSPVRGPQEVGSVVVDSSGKWNVIILLSNSDPIATYYAIATKNGKSAQSNSVTIYWEKVFGRDDMADLVQAMIEGGVDFMYGDSHRACFEDAEVSAAEKALACGDVAMTWADMGLLGAGSVFPPAEVVIAAGAVTSKIVVRSLRIFVELGDNAKYYRIGKAVVKAIRIADLPKILAKVNKVDQAFTLSEKGAKHIIRWHGMLGRRKDMMCFTDWDDLTILWSAKNFGSAVRHDLQWMTKDGMKAWRAKLVKEFEARGIKYDSSFPIDLDTFDEIVEGAWYEANQGDIMVCGLFGKKADGSIEMFGYMPIPDDFTLPPNESQWFSPQAVILPVSGSVVPVVLTEPPSTSTPIPGSASTVSVLAASGAYVSLAVGTVATMSCTTAFTGGPVSNVGQSVSFGGGMITYTRVLTIGTDPVPSGFVLLGR